MRNITITAEIDETSSTRNTTEVCEAAPTIERGSESMTPAMLRAAPFKSRVAMRPRLFSCPWCGDAGAPVDRTLPPGLRLCDTCSDADLSVRMCPQPPPEWFAGFRAWEISHGYQPPAPDPREEHRASLRAGLLAALREFGTRWPGCEFGKAAVGTMFLDALKAAGADPAAELDRALAGLTCEEYGRLRCYVSGLPEVQGGEWPAAPAKRTRKNTNEVSGLKFLTVGGASGTLTEP